MANIPSRSRISRLAWVALSTLLFYSLAAGWGNQSWTPTRKGQYGTITRQALDRLLASAAKLQTGDKAGAKIQLQGMQADIAELSRSSGFFREQANREYGRCVSHIRGLDTRVGQLYKDDSQLQKQIQDVDAKLTKVTTERALTENQIADVTNALRAAEVNLRRRRERLEELAKWWWVPGYGQYLAIRTLVDDDIGNYNSLRNTLNDSSVQLGRHQQALLAANVIRQKLAAEAIEMESTLRNLKKMRGEAEADLVNLKTAAVFLTEAQAFWDQVDRLLRLDIGQSVSAAVDISNLEKLLKKGNKSPLFNAWQKRPAVELYDSLIAFSDTLDQGNNFLLAEESEFCGGPPRTTGGPALSTKCDISQFTKYYEITDPKTCSFRYLNPPSCPPQPRPTTSAVSPNRSQAIWLRASNQNWIGRARCESPLAIYYGKMQTPAACERACMADEKCATWTYNVSNVYMPGSATECWGGAPGLAPLKQDWNGFQSGGIQTK